MMMRRRRRRRTVVMEEVVSGSCVQRNPQMMVTMMVMMVVFRSFTQRLLTLNPSGGWVHTSTGGGDRDEGTKDAIGHFLLELYRGP